MLKDTILEASKHLSAAEKERLKKEANKAKGSKFNAVKEEESEEVIKVTKKIPEIGDLVFYPVESRIAKEINTNPSLESSRVFLDGKQVFTKRIYKGKELRPFMVVNVKSEDPAVVSLVELIGAHIKKDGDMKEIGEYEGLSDGFIRVNQLGGAGGYANIFNYQEFTDLIIEYDWPSNFKEVYMNELKYYVPVEESVQKIDYDLAASRNGEITKQSQIDVLKELRSYMAYVNIDIFPGWFNSMKIGKKMHPQYYKVRKWINKRREERPDIYNLY